MESSAHLKTGSKRNSVEFFSILPLFSTCFSVVTTFFGFQATLLLTIQGLALVSSS